jgi:hypothetical protein
MRWSLAVGLVLAGYGIGRWDAVPVVPAWAQDAPATLNEETQKKIQLANESLKTAMEALKVDSLYTPVTKSMNVYGILTGGLDAMADLESGRGVDPETFAALYAGDAIDEVQQHLSKDEEGRLTYKNKVVRIYPVTKLQKLHTQRKILTGELRPSAAQDQ